MLRIFRIIVRAFLPDRPRPRPRLVAEPVSADRETTVKKQAHSAADLTPLLEGLPQVRVLRVLDGDTLIVANGWGQTMIRLDSIDCPEDGQHWGNTAAAGLVKLVGGRRVILEEHGLDLHGRTLATIYVQHANADAWQNVNERMVTLGHAWVTRAYYDHLPKDRQAKLNRLEAWAKSKKVGLWRTENPIPPWQWRKRRNSG